MSNQQASGTRLFFHLYFQSRGRSQAAAVLSRNLHQVGSGFRSLLMDRFRERVTNTPGFVGQDRCARKAFELVLGGAAQRAFDLGQESEAIRDRFGRDSLGEKLLLARRLVEAGVTYVTLSDAWGHWDHHGDEVRWGGIVKGLTPMLPELDRGLTALVKDLDERGLLATTLVIVAGEFGRSPIMTKTAGRDHWPP